MEQSLDCEMKNLKTNCNTKKHDVDISCWTC